MPLAFLAVGLPQQQPGSTSASHSPSQARLYSCVSALRPCRIRCFAFHNFACACELQPMPASHVSKLQRPPN
ncbi:hypothetical protein TIFTF001_053853 [Ficus carica]|uniref:Uncharacterized protein n=1 Tax=Ficus carica TaxID=3494 RepID=A0AA88EGB6_FICCA|nr:hypothetical protein TIFTF001_011659 [Ficus carica]GMN74447.1 hypothetical protein TIFTF001_053853 [Ficus carica]